MIVISAGELLAQNATKVPRDREPLQTGSAPARATKGAPYPPGPVKDRAPDHDMPPQPVPDGPKAGDMKPTRPPFELDEFSPKFRKATERRTRPPAPSLVFDSHAELPNSVASTSGCCPEVSVAENGRTVLMTGNGWLAVSQDSGATFSNLNPTTIFPQDDGGFCCDQVIQYVPKIDMFVWLLQYWEKNGANRIRLAAQTTRAVRRSNGQDWTYWDFPSTVFTKTGGLDYNDMTFGSQSLWWTTQSSEGRVVVRIALSEIDAQSTINYVYTPGTDALWSHVTHDARSTVYWAGHVDSSTIRVFSMKDGDGYYSWRSVAIDTWPNGTNSSTCPDGSDWLAYESWKHYVFGNCLQGGSVWFGWLASAGGGFPQPHIQLVRIDVTSWTKQEQVQVWNPKFALMDPYLSTNSKGEMGMDVAFGGGSYYPSNAVGVWGDFVVYYPRLSTRCTDRWGDYNTCRRSGSNTSVWVAGGYTAEVDAGGNNIMLPHYIKFRR
ncbi:MAG: hypothetical protein U0166_02675 [Acidobacteriota bacterium]